MKIIVGSQGEGIKNKPGEIDMEKYNSFGIPATADSSASSNLKRVYIKSGFFIEWCKYDLGVVLSIGLYV